MKEEYPRHSSYGASSQYNPTRFRGVNDLYSYSNLRMVTPTEQIKTGPYTALIEHPRSAFITFAHESYKLQSEYGWKFHISVNDENFKNVEKAWDILKDILIRHSIKLSKVVRPDFQISIKIPKQRGKQITIYQFLNAELENWEQILIDITYAFTKNGIEPGHAPISDHPIRGTPYVYYRTDADSDGKPIEGRDEPGERNHIFDAFNVILQPKPEEKLLLLNVKPYEGEQPAFKMK